MSSHQEKPNVVLYTDSEFNSMMGRLISIALVSSCGEYEFYEVTECPDPLDPWVAENVIPILGKEAIPLEDLKAKLSQFLDQFGEIKIVADYPIDHKYLVEVMETGPGEWFGEKTGRQVHLVIDDRLSAKAAVTPHNALSDARAIRDSAMVIEYDAPWRW